MPLDISSNTAESLMTAIYGSAATFIGVITVYQGRRAWLIWYNFHHTGADHAVGAFPSAFPLHSLVIITDLARDLELGPTVSCDTTEESENLQHSDVNAVQAPSHDSAVSAPSPALIQPHRAVFPDEVHVAMTHDAQSAL